MLAQPAARQNPVRPWQVIVDVWAEGADWPELARELEGARSAQQRWLQDKASMRVLVEGVLRSLQMDEQIAFIDRLGFLGFQARCAESAWRCAVCITMCLLKEGHHASNAVPTRRCTVMPYHCSNLAGGGSKEALRLRWSTYSRRRSAMLLTATLLVVTSQCTVLQGPFSLNDADTTYRLIVADRAKVDSVPDVVNPCAMCSQLLDHSSAVCHSSDAAAACRAGSPQSAPSSVKLQN